MFLQYVPEPSTRLGPEILDSLVRSPRDVQTGSALWWSPKLVARLERRVIASKSSNVGPYHRYKRPIVNGEFEL